MTTLKRPEMKLANTKVSEEDMIYFSLGLDAEDYVLPSERDNYTSDARAVQLVQDIQAGKDLSGQDFSGINLKGANLSGGHFAGSSFKGAIFYKTQATNADFSGCDFTEAYFEDVDFSDSILSGAQFQKTYLRRLKLDGSQSDEELKKRLTAMEFLIFQLESGRIDIHSLTQSELMCLDLRRLDLSKVDISDIDLSYFNLEGVNLCGVYIKPLQRLSMAQWQKDLLAVEKLKEKKLKEENLKVLKQRCLELEAYARKQTEVQPVKAKKTKRPAIKEDEFNPQSVPVSPQQPEEKPADDKSEQIMAPNRIQLHTPKIQLKTKLKTKKIKNRT